MRAREPRISAAEQSLKVRRFEWVMRRVTGLQDMLYE
jgi:hypothetical protein